MRATINGKAYDTDESERVTDYPSPDGDDALYRSAASGFFLVNMVAYLDGRRLRPCESVEHLAPELEPMAARMERRRRLRCAHEIIPLTDREAMAWCIKAHIPECFRGYLLEAI